MRFLRTWSGRIVSTGWWSLRAVLAWIGQHDLGVLTAGFIILLSLGGFAELIDLIGEGETQRFDEWFVRIMRRPEQLDRPIGPRWLEEAGRDVTALGSVLVLTLLTASVAGFLWLTRAYRSMWLVLASTITGVVATFVLKSLIARPRPTVVPHLSHVSTASFPSGHSMMSAVVFLTLGAILAESVESRVLKAYFLLVAGLLTFLVGVSRVFLGVHYPSDVLGGWIAGLAWALGCGLVARLLHRRSASAIQAPLPDAQSSSGALDR